MSRRSILTRHFQELGLGVYDGFTGVVTQPIKGGREEGLPGVYKGIGKGLGGLFFKPLAGKAHLAYIRRSSLSSFPSLLWDVLH